MSIGSWKNHDGLWRKIMARGIVEDIVETDDRDDKVDDPMYNTGSQGDGKTSGGGKKWTRARKANEVPGPKMGAKPHRDCNEYGSRGTGTNPNPKQQSGGPYVCCQRKQCRGVRGRASFRFVADILQSKEEIFCISCDAPWEWSFEQAVLKGQVPGYKAKDKGNARSVPANPHQKLESPFVETSNGS